MAGSIWSHIEKAISDILSEKDENISVACWELHLAVEKAFKVYISQHSSERCYVHDLIKLCEKASKLGLVIDATLLASLPSDKEAISMRYGDLQEDPRIVSNHYLTALKLVCSITEQFKREFSIYNASFLIKKSDWAR